MSNWWFVFLVGLALNLGAGVSRAETSAQDAFRALHQGPPLRTIQAENRLEIRIFEDDVVIPEDFIPSVFHALDTLEAVFRPLQKPLIIQVGSDNALAIAYSPALDAILFPGSPKVKNYGLFDHDRLRHEMFHAVAGRTLPHLVTPEALKRPNVRTLHEGAADFFAALLDSNEVFGEDYFTFPTVLRRYQTPMVYSLVQGSHAKGNTLTSYWLQKKWTLAKLVGRLKEGCESTDCLVEPSDQEEFGLGGPHTPRATASLEGVPVSKLGKYRVKDGSVVRIATNPALVARFPLLTHVFTDKHGKTSQSFSFESVAPLSSDPKEGVRRFRIRIRGEGSIEKIIVRHVSEGDVVGFDVLYLRPL